jgi:splicing factor 3A subunit 3
VRKVFTNKNVFAARLKGKRYARALKAAEALGGAGKQEARTEYLVSKVCESLLADCLLATKRQVQKKQSLSYEEWQKELQEQALLDAGEDQLDDHDDGMDSEDEAELVRGIKDYPVDWEGKPIPYWLYKLHGLGVSYYCEISGGVYYKGYRAFQRHFDEPAYLEGLRRLGVPSRYHKYFFGVTRIADAVACRLRLWCE